MKLLIVTVALALVIASLSCHNAVQFSQAVFNSSAATTKLHFPQPWLDERDSSTSIQQIEVRKLPNSSGDEFLFGALPDGDNFYASEVDKTLPKPDYGKNFFCGDICNYATGSNSNSAGVGEWSTNPDKATVCW